MLLIIRVPRFQLVGAYDSDTGGGLSLTVPQSPIAFSPTERVSILAPVTPSRSYRDRNAGARTSHPPRLPRLLSPIATLDALGTQLIAVVVPPRVCSLMCWSPATALPALLAAALARARLRPPHR